MNVVLAVLLSVAAAKAHAVTAVVQERLAARLARPSRSAGKPFVAAAGLVRHGSWWLAVGVAVTAAMLHVLALRYGPLIVVQPLGALTLVLALPLRAAVIRRKVEPAEWRGAGLTVAGVAVLLSLTATGAPRRTFDPIHMTALSFTTFAVVAVLIVAASLMTRRVVRSLLFATAAGVAFAVASALTQALVVRGADGGPPTLFRPAAVAVLVLAGGALLLAQAAYRAGLGAPLATLTLVNPIIASVIGVTLLGERYAAGPLGATLAVLAAIVAGHGVLVLTRTHGVASTGAPGGQWTLTGPKASLTATPRTRWTV